MTAVSAEQCVASDGLIQPDKIPGAASSDNTGGQLNAAAITDACQQARHVASQVRTGVSDVSTAWTAVPAAFEMPGAEPVHNAMTAPGTSLVTFAANLDTMARALEDFAGEIEPLRISFDEVRTRAQEFVDSLEPGNKVWMRASSTTAYQWDGNASAHMSYSASTYGTGSYSTSYNASTYGTNGAASTESEWYSEWDAVAYLRGRGETARVSGGTVEILVSWLESGEHVGRNNDLMDEVADLYARLHSAEVDCANRINALREDACVAPLEAVEAWQLKQDGVELPWGSRVEEKRNCGEQVGHGFYEFGKGTVEGLGSLISYNYMTGEWGDGEHFKQSWAGIGDIVVSISTLTGGPLGFINLAVNGPDAYSDSLETVTELGKSLVAWDTWEDAPAQAATETILNIGTAFIPVGGWALAGAKGLSAAAGATRIASALTKLDNLGPAVLARLGGGGFKIDMDVNVNIDAPPIRVDADAPTIRPDADAPRVDADATTNPGGLADDAARAGDDSGPSTAAGKPDDSPSSPGSDAADDAVRAGDDTSAPDAADTANAGGAVDDAAYSGGGDGPGPGSPSELTVDGHNGHTYDELVRERIESGEWQDPGTRPAWTDDVSRGESFFGEAALEFFEGQDVTLGAKGRVAFLMPADDGARIVDARSAAILTGMAPSVERAALEGGRLFGINVPLDGLELRVPTFHDAGGNIHFVPGGFTAVKQDGLFYTNPTREAVVDGGMPLPRGTALFEVMPDGTRTVMRVFQ
ncbi:hypothetical protein [Demequina muriae]|uniref:Uncharacterized protein n=1 Tax=Demequina muriae TaxID=3051664 RepID=A0ABT8GG89_9MICO|nr:hypothetical protein [Demequina sp. EGI L300058]MDN4480274.1 hypothetical protein [Demequina sp. EGI L300058]